jgi:hypothetical protein
MYLMERRTQRKTCATRATLNRSSTRPQRSLAGDRRAKHRRTAPSVSVPHWLPAPRPSPAGGAAGGPSCPSYRPAAAMSSREVRRSAWTSSSAGRSGVTSSKEAPGSAARGRPLQPRGRERSLEGLVRVHLAWLYVLHAHLKGDGVDYRHRQPESRRFTGVDPRRRSPRRSASGDDR